jgi:hypothetical protein
VITWKIFYDPATLGMDPAVVGDYWRVADDTSSDVDQVVATPEDAPENGVLVVIFEHSRVGRRVLFGDDFYVYRRNLPNADPNQWTQGNETMFYAAVERGDVPSVSLSGDPVKPYTIPEQGNKTVDVDLTGIITYASDKKFTIKRGVYVAEQHMERCLIAAQNDADLPPASNWPPNTVWSPQPDPDA